MQNSDYAHIITHLIVHLFSFLSMLIETKIYHLTHHTTKHNTPKFKKHIEIETFQIKNNKTQIYVNYLYLKRLVGIFSNSFLIQGITKFD